MKNEKIMMQEMNYVLPQQNAVPAPNEKVKTKMRLIEGRKPIKKAKAVLWIALIFAAFFIVTIRYSQMTNLNYEISDMKSELTAQNAVNSALSMELDKKTNIIQIKHMAEAELGMQEPDKYQIVYINVPRANKVTIAEEAENSRDNSIGLIEYLKAFIFGNR